MMKKSKKTTTEVKDLEPTADPKAGSFTGGVRVAVGDVNGDSVRPTESLSIHFKKA